MISQFFKHSFIYGLANFLSRGISLLLIPLFTRVLPPADYGALDILTIVGNLVSLVVTLEISQGFARLLPEAATESERNAYASTTLWYTVCSYLIFLSAALLFSDKLCLALMGSPQWEGVVRLAIWSIALNGVFYMLQAQLRWELQTRKYAVVSVVVMLVSTGLSAFLVLVVKDGVAGMFYGQIAGAFTGGALSWYFSRKRYLLLFVGEKCKRMLNISIPIVPSSVNVFIMLYVDRIAIKQLMTLDDVGLYGIAYRFASLVSLFLFGFNSALTPLVYNRYRLESTPPEIASIFRYFLVWSLTSIVVIATYAKEILVIFATPRYYEAWAVMPVIAGAILLSSMYIFMPGMDIAKKTSKISFINIVSGLTNIPLNLLLIPILGIMGAAIATFISSVLMFSLYTHFSQKLYYIPHKWHKIISAVLLCATTAIVEVVTVVHTLIPVQFQFQVKTALSVVTVVGVLLILIEPEEFQRLKERIICLLAANGEKIGS